MLKLSFLKVQEVINQADNLLDYPKLSFLILRNITIEPIEPYLKYLAYQAGFNAQVRFGGYDNIFQETVTEQDNILGNGIDCILVFMRLETLSESLAHNFAGLKPNDILGEVGRIKSLINTILDAICSKTKAMILWHGFELFVYPSLGIFDSQTNDGQIAIVQELNVFLRDSLKEHKNTYFVDLNLVLARLGRSNFYDLRYWHIGRLPFTKEALSEIAYEDFKFIRALKGKNKKCLVLDCDNVLWGGLIGEDGLAGIKLGKAYPGSAYLEFQQEIVNLYHKGIIIALCSRNNKDDVWEVFHKHPDMILKEEHIATAQINWQDKVSNLKQIAMDLNIGLDSVVFMDDSASEIAVVRQALPEVEAIHLPEQIAVEYRDILASCGLFDTLVISEMDRERGSMYRAEASRKKLKAHVINVEEYYKLLEMVVEIRFVDEFSVPRIAQLTQRTNQFNLTTKRYSEADIKAFVENNASDILYLKLRDKFGDYGIVGVCILKYQQGTAIFDTFLLSCRVLGRGVENILLAKALKLALNKGCCEAIGEYYATQKNVQVEYFYAKQGFEEIENIEKKATKVFRYKLDKGVQTELKFFKNLLSDVE